MKAIRRSKETKQATREPHYKVNESIKKNILMLILDIKSKDLSEEKRALMDMVNGITGKISVKQGNTLKEYIQDNKDINEQDKRKYIDTLTLISYGYVIR